MLALTRKTHYALIALTHLASDPGGFVSAKTIAERYKLPHPLMMNLLKQLNQYDLVRSVRGPRGGYTLTVSPEDIRLSDVIRAVEGPILLTQCAPNEDPECEAEPCGRAHQCPVRSSLQLVHDRITDFLDNITLAEILQNSGSTLPHAVPSANEQEQAANL